MKVNGWYVNMANVDLRHACDMDRGRDVGQKECECDPLGYPTLFPGLT